MSDSESDYEDLETGVTSVYLGFAGKEALRDELSLQDNHVGGIPVWLGSACEPPPAELITCLICSKFLDLLAQLSCPLPEANYDRIIYIFACSDPNCRRKKGSIRAIKGCDASEEVKQRIATESQVKEPQNTIVPLGDSLFASSSSSNPFSEPSQPSKLTASQNNKRKVRNKKGMQVVGGRYTCKIVEVEQEYLEKYDVPLSGLKIEEMETEPEQDSEKPSDTKELESNTDTTFTRFIEVVENNPDQILRYELGLKPLLYCQDECASELANLSSKTLEIQLMPHLISELETVDMLVDGMEWGSIFVACSSSLPSLNEHGIGYEEEWVGVQWE